MKMSFLLLLVILNACATVTENIPDRKAVPAEAANHKEICIDQAAAKESLAFIEASIDQSSPGSESATTLERQTCLTRVYNRKGFRILLFKKPEDPADQIGTRFGNAPFDTTKTSECLSHAENDLSSLDLPLATRVLEKGKLLYGSQWRDPDGGALYWLNCADSSSLAYHDSLATLIHETTHAFLKDSCIFSPGLNATLCLDLPSTLPSSSIASFSSFPFESKQAIESSKQIQQTYMFQQAPPILMFDELNGYTTTTAVYTAILKKKGGEAIFIDQKMRPAITQTAFMAYSLRYLAEFRRIRSAEFELMFGAGTPNRKNLVALFDESEKVYAEWLPALAAAGGRASESEVWFLRQYQEARQALQW